jgi:hypothetical protein
MDKIITVAMIFIIVFTAGFFGNHFGYTVDGVPQGGLSIKAWDEYPYFSPQLILGWWEHAFTGNDQSVIAGVLDYLFNFTTFQIDNVPLWLSGIFDLIVLLAFVLIFLMIRGE